MSKIKLLSDDLVNQIAAGEIVERPASALKELIENSIDANSKNVEIFLQNGGKTKIVIQDDGEGISKDDLPIAIQRHATSKLSGNNLFDIKSYGFRGEALPSIASVSNFSLESGTFGISVNFSEQSEIFPSVVEKGTKVTVQNLFEKIPARLKFLRSDSVELTSCLNVVENISLTNPNINFSLRNENKQLLSFQNDSLDFRVSKILGADIFKKAIHFEERSDHIAVSGYLFHPIDNRYSQNFQRIFINGRVVKDKTVSLAIRNAYKDLIPVGRFAVAVIFIEIDPFHLDVNVSPTKSEVRFRDNLSVQRFLTDAIKKNLQRFDRVSNEIDFSSFSDLNFDNKTDKIDISKVHVLYDGPSERSGLNNNPSKNQNTRISSAPQNFEPFHQPVNDHFSPIERLKPKTDGALALSPRILPEKSESFFGTPVAQVFESYIITKTQDGLMIIDQHAVHEKITQHKILEGLTSNNKQFLVKPEILELSNSELEIAKFILENLKECGFALELIQNSLMISAIPSVINPDEAKNFVRNILSDHNMLDNLQVLDTIKKRIADKACHNSIRFGRELSFDEMSAIIQQMEEVPSIHQCNHHRPSFITISKDQLKKLFERT